MSIERLTWPALPSAERAELDAIVRERQDTFYSTLAEVAPFWGLVVAGAIAGAAASFVQMGGIDALTSFNVDAPLLAYRFPAAFVACTVIAIATLVTWSRNHGRRGYAATSFGIVRVRGRKLRLIRHAALARGRRSQHGKAGKRFTALELTAQGGGSMTLLASHRWTDLAVGAIARARGGHAPIEN